MFENLLYQSTIVENLSREVSLGVLPQSLLFYGPEYSGKLTAALELARVLTCKEGRAQWGCGCKSCEMHRQLDHPYLILTGKKDLMGEIQGALSAAQTLDSPATRYMVIRSFRKLTIRFHPLLWEGEDVKIKKFQGLLTSLNEGLDDFQISAPPLKAELWDKLVPSLIKDAEKLQGYLPKAIPVNQIRKISNWAYTSGSSRKVILLEEADLMQESARNALLKILEEPPEGVFFILLTKKRAAILPTLLSRLRIYSLSDRTPLQQQEVLKRIFRDDIGEYRTLKEYFLAWKGLRPGEMNSMAREFWTAVKEKSPIPPIDLAGKENFLIFLEALTDVMRIELQEGSSSIDLLQRQEKMLKGIKEAIYGVNSLNQNPALALETLFYSLKV